MAGSRTLKLSILADVDDLIKKLKSASDDTETFGSKVEKVGKVVGAAFAAAASAAAAFAVKIGIEAVKSASDLSETVSKVNVIFGDSAKAINAFAETAASKLGQTKQQALDATSTFATFGKAAGLSGNDLVNFSTGFTKLASDLASFNNTSPEQAINAIGAALRGESEPLRTYGVLLDDASMRQAALELGLISTTKNALTPQQKVLAAQELIYRQTAAAQGDFERTSDGLANKQRILTAQFENIKTVIGSALLPIVLDLAKVFETNVLPIIQNLADSIGNGQGLISSFESVANIISKVFIPVWNGLKSAFSSISEAIDNNKESFMAFGKLIAEYVAPVVGTVLGGAIKGIGVVVSGVINLIGDVANVVVKVVNGAISAVNTLIKAYNAIPLLPNIPTIGNISAPNINVPSASVSASNIKVPTIPSIAAPSVSSGVSTTTTAAAESLKIVPINPSGYTSAYAKSFSDTSATQSPVTIAPTINIGVAGDPQGVANTIVDVLTQATARGGMTGRILDL